MIFKSLLEIFIDISDSKIIIESEDFKWYELQIDYSNVVYTSKNNEKIKGILNKYLKFEDVFTLEIKNEYEEVISIESLNNIENFLNKLTEFDSTVNWLIQIKISKKVTNYPNFKKINIYDINLLLNIDSPENQFNFIKNFSNFINKYHSDFYYFKLINDDYCFKSETCVFSNQENFEFNRKINREKLVNLRNSNVNIIYNNIETFMIIPYDLHLIEDSHNENINSYFNHLSKIITFFYIFNYAEMLGNVCRFTLEGYKTITKNIKLDEVYLSDSNSIFFNIFEWVYDNSMVTGRLEIARNLLSIHELSVNALDDFNVEEITTASVKSAHKIYMKENTEKYITALNNVSNSLFNIRLKADEIVQELFSNFKNNLLAFFTLFITIILTNVFSTTGSARNVITFDIAFITTILAIISIGINIASNFVLKRKIKWMKKNLENLKERYDKILNEEESSLIFSNFDLDDTIISKNKKTYNILWIGSIIIIIVSVWLCQQKIISYELLVNFVKNLKINILN